VENTVNVDKHGRRSFFPMQLTGLVEVRDEQRRSIQRRCEKAVELTEGHKTSVYWCNLNDEGDLLQELDPSAHQISGSMNLDKKEELLIAFFDKKIPRLITKAKMTAFGLNWQHCNHTTYFPTFSYEQYYQAIRRFWRFGQTKEVTCDLVYSEGQKKVLQSLLAKSKKANELFTKLNSNLNQSYTIKESEFKNELTLPSFI
jgi:hypothetical protein